MILARFILKIVALRVLAALVALVAILQVLDLLDVATDVLDRGQGAGGLLRYAVLRLPRLIEQALPLAVLAGGLFAFAQLARENAITAIRASGVSLYRVVALALPVAGVAVAVQAIMAQGLAPRTDAGLADWWSATAPATERAEATTRTFRAGEDIITASATPDRPGVLSAVRIYRRAPDGRLQERITAATATLFAGRWRLDDVQATILAEGAGETVRVPTRLWNTSLTTSDIAGVFSDASRPSPAEARRALRDGASLRPPAFYRMQLQRLWAAPVACLVMLLLAAPMAMVNVRSGRAPLVMAACLAAGLLFLVVDGLLTALGEGGGAPVWLAAWAGSFVFAAAAATVLMREEG